MRSTSGKTVEAPSDDKRWRIVTATMRRHGFERDAVIESLHSAQEAFGYLDDEALRYVAQNLNTPLSLVYGVATFYNFFTLKPQGGTYLRGLLGNCLLYQGRSPNSGCYLHTAGVETGTNHLGQESFSASGTLPGRMWTSSSRSF